MKMIDSISRCNNGTWEKYGVLCGESSHFAVKLDKIPSETVFARHTHRKCAACGGRLFASSKATGKSRFSCFACGPRTNDEDIAPDDPIYIHGGLMDGAQKCGFILSSDCNEMDLYSITIYDHAPVGSWLKVEE